MIVANLLGPNKHDIKASSDIHSRFFIVLSNFFFKKIAASVILSTGNHTNGSATRIFNYK